MSIERQQIIAKVERVRANMWRTAFSVLLLGFASTGAIFWSDLARGKTVSPAVAVIPCNSLEVDGFQLQSGGAFSSNELVVLSDSDILIAKVNALPAGCSGLIYRWYVDDQPLDVLPADASNLFLLLPAHLDEREVVRVVGVEVSAPGVAPVRMYATVLFAPSSN